ncbi:MAG: carboxypeptidase regulatory-like domain-containing protein [Acidobacteria bacterium]|nr:carboxypeptidase regulatory-like domain-containing protein [Acidobacteriota bacterium]
MLIRRLPFVFLLTIPMFAQESRGWILGRITDVSGAVVAGAHVTALNTATNVAVSARTNSEGRYEAPYLLPGMYRVSVEMPGFQRAVREGIELRTADRLSLNFELQVGAQAESVTVSAETPILETTTASSGMVMDERRVRELPVVGGNAMYLTRLSAGVTVTGGHSAGNPTDLGGATGVIINGVRGGNTEASLDGVPNMQGSNSAYSPPQDLVQEFKVQTNNYDAGVGRSAGAVVNVSMRSGTNEFHGTAYLNDSRIRAVPWFSNGWLYDPATGPVTEAKRQQAAPGWLHQRWGATASGPVRIPGLYDGRNRTFWVFGYEGLKINRQPTYFATVPARTQIAGDFSPLLAAGKQYQIYDPRTIATAAGGRFSRQPLPGNIVPASRIDPVASKILSYYPAPNTAGTSDGRQNYFGVQKEPKDYKGFVSRVDHNISDKHRLFGRVNWTDYSTGVQTLPTIAVGTTTTQKNFSAVLDDVYVFTPQLLLNVRGGFTYFAPNTYPVSRGFDITSLGFPSSLVSQITRLADPLGLAFPVVYIDEGAYAQLSAEGGNPQTRAYQNYQGTLTRIAGNHTVRAGGDYRVYRESTNNFGSVAPRIESTRTWTRGPLDNSPVAPIGQGLASLLMGYPTGGRVNVNSSSAEQSLFMASFVQDDWKLSRRLTVNLGVRWEFDSPIRERYNRSIRDYDFAAANPASAAVLANYAKNPIPEVPVAAFQTKGGLTFAGANGQPRALWNADRNNVMPRIGVAWNVNSKTVARGGYGVFFMQSGADRQATNLGGFNQATNLIPSNNNGLTFQATLANPFPAGIEAPQGAAQGMRTLLGRTISFFQSNQRTAYMQRWSAGIQRSLGWRSLVEVQYVGNRGTALAVSTNFNPIPAKYLSKSLVRDQPVIDYLTATVVSPFYGLADFAGTGLANNRVARSQLLKPYPHFVDMTNNQSAGASWYHGLQATYEKRLSSGFTVQVAYTWSKFMEATAYLNDTDPAPEHVISDLDFPQRLTVSGIWEIPVGRGRRMGRSMPRFWDGLAGGWQIQAWYEGQSGPALGFGNVSFYGNLADIVLPISQRHPTRWFNTAAGFERSSANALANNVRTLGTRFTGIRADGVNNLDASLFKNLKITERFTTQLRIETYNTLNHVQFAEPNTTPANTAFGTVSAEKGHGQRQITFGAKLIF